MARTFLLYADGYSKEMDINSASPDSVAPLPFHAMSAYPYPPTEHYPSDGRASGLSGGIQHAGGQARVLTRRGY